MSERDPPSPFLLLRIAERLGGKSGDHTDPLDVLLAQGWIDEQMATEGRVYRWQARVLFGSGKSQPTALGALVPAGIGGGEEPYLDDIDDARADYEAREAALRRAGPHARNAVRTVCLDWSEAVAVPLLRHGLSAMTFRARLTPRPKSEKEVGTEAGRGAPAASPRPITEIYARPKPQGPAADLRVRDPDTGELVPRVWLGGRAAPDPEDKAR